MVTTYANSRPKIFLMHFFSGQRFMPKIFVLVYIFPSICEKVSWICLYSWTSPIIFGQVVVQINIIVLEKDWDTKSLGTSLKILFLNNISLIFKYHVTLCLFWFTRFDTKSFDLQGVGFDTRSYSCSYFSHGLEEQLAWSKHTILRVNIMNYFLKLFSKNW